MLDEREFARFGPYLIVRTSGAGGMGRIQLALRSGADDSDVCVLKRMHVTEQLPEQRARFEREARIAARLSHPNIGRTYRVQTIEGELCLAQEFIDGANLSRVMRQAGDRGLPPASAAHIVREVAHALAYAHELGGLEIVHRDITPENIMLSWAGEVKLIDFGLARSTVDGTVTSLGMIVGRRSYMAPEIWAGERPDRRADIFSLGAVLWELLAVKRLEDLDEALWREGVPDPRMVRPDAPASLAAIAMKALSVAAKDRYQSAAEMADALAGVADSTKDPTSELAAVLAFFFNVDLAQEVVRGEIADARNALRAEEPLKPSGSSAPAIAIGITAAALVLVCFVGVRGWRRGSAATPAAVTAEGRSRKNDLSAAHVVHAPAGPEPSPRAPAPQFAPSERALPTTEPTSTGRHQDRQPSTEQLLKEANDRFDDGKLGDAVALARRAAALGAGAPAHALLGHVFMSQGEFDRAEREFALAVRMDSRNTEAAARLADVRRARLEQEQ